MSARTVESFVDLLEAIKSQVPDPGPICLVQLSHAGLQSSSVEALCRAPWIPAVAPCAARPDVGDTYWAFILKYILWPLPSRQIIDHDEWLEIADMFVRSARVVAEAGWDGIQLHSAHGYLLAEYLSPMTNPDPLALPGVPSAIPLRLGLLWLVLTGVRRATAPTFVIAVKINCSDFVRGGLDESHSEEIIRQIVSWRLVDMLEISGGTYASPAFATLESISGDGDGGGGEALAGARGPSRQSLFAHFTSQLLPHLPPPPIGPAILLTGSLHSRDLIASSLRTNTCHLAGIGRPACLYPQLPNDIMLNRQVEASAASVGGYTVPGAEMARWILSGFPAPAPAAAAPTLYNTNEVSDGTKAVTSGGKSAERRSATPTVRGIPLIGAGVSTLWHEWQLSRLGRGARPDPHINWFFALWVELFWWGLLGGGPWGWYLSWRRGDYKRGRVRVQERESSAAASTSSQ
jgi:2,4-dienoyl-CoA reductase-like NADH-dependent reductase (Old Yellow Enzyme family)